jgi:pimeloyl-ACP methyl ester carboxylesterase
LRKDDARRVALALGKEGRLMLSLVIAAAAVAAATPLTAPGPQGLLAGTLVDAGRHAPVVLIIPGSGPTDRDGNNPMGVAAASYRLLAEALATKGVSTVRIDKRGLGGSKAAVADGNKVTIADYATDTHNWVAAIRKKTGQRCVWLLGHSEGSLVAFASAQQPEGICGVISVSGAGRKLSDVIREQLRSNPANAPVLESAMTALDSLERGEHVDVTNMHPALQQLFAPQVQDFLIDMFRYDPPKLAATLKVPLLIIQGERDLQVSVADARALAAAQPKAKLDLLPRMNHVLKDIDSDDSASNLATYGNPSLPVDASAVQAIAQFVKR